MISLLKASNIDTNPYITQLFCNFIDQIGMNKLIISSVLNRTPTLKPNNIIQQTTIFKNNHTILVIGRNSRGQFGLNHSNRITKLTDFNDTHPDKPISNIYCGEDHIIYTNNAHSKYWIAANIDGEISVWRHDRDEISKLRPINYFQDRNINIKKICVNSTSMSTYWITKNKGFVCCQGGNSEGLLGLSERYIQKNQIYNFNSFLLMMTMTTNHYIISGIYSVVHNMSIDTISGLVLKRIMTVIKLVNFEYINMKINVQYLNL